MEGGARVAQLWFTLIGRYLLQLFPSSVLLTIPDSVPHGCGPFCRAADEPRPQPPWVTQPPQNVRWLGFLRLPSAFAQTALSAAALALRQASHAG